MNRPASSRKPQALRRILVRGVNWLGDAVMSTPALLRLRERFPQAHIALLTPDKLGDLWLDHPALDEVITFAPGEGLFSVSRKLRAGRFDLALVLPNSPRSAMEVWLANIARRVGYTRPWRNCFLTQISASRAGAVEMHKRSTFEINQLITGAVSPASSILPPATAHHIHQYLHLVAALGANLEPLAPQLVVTGAELDAVAARFSLNAASTGGRPLLALNAGAEYGPAKRWPVERFIAVALETQRRTNCLWLIIGGKGDSPLASQIAAAFQASRFTCYDLCGRTSLRELMCVLKLCRALLTNDTGPMHIAAALGTPVIVPFGSTSPEMTGPGLPGYTHHRLLKSAAPCAPCFLRECPIDFRCMMGISVERVAEAVVSVLR